MPLVRVPAEPYRAPCAVRQMCPNSQSFNWHKRRQKTTIVTRTNHNCNEAHSYAPKCSYVASPRAAKGLEWMITLSMVIGEMGRNKSSTGSCSRAASVSRPSHTSPKIVFFPSNDG